MGETASTWKTPLHSSDSEHPEQTRRNFKGKGAPFDINRGERSFPRRLSDLDTNAQTSNHNPFDTDGD
jgi:hypothetical protein